MDKYPTLQDIRKGIVGKDGRPVKIIQKIAAGNFKDFGMYLLNDEDMTDVDNLERNHCREGTEGITEAIIKKWLDTGTTPRTYKHLIKCIKDCELGALAEKIENALSDSNTASPLPAAVSNASSISPIHVDRSSAAAIHSVHTDDGDTENDEKPKYPMEQIDELAATYSKSLRVPSDKEKFKKDAADKVIVVIQSCNIAEYYAALPKLAEPVKYPSCKCIVVGTFAGKNAAIVRTGQGNDCRDDLKEILDFFPNAKYLLGLGICMGINRKFGDVLIGKKLQCEDNLKLENGRLKLRGDSMSVQKTMKSAFCDDTRGWIGFECTATAEVSTAKTRTSKVYTGCILSSPALINGEVTKEGLEKESQTIIGAEMEGWVLFKEFKHIDSIIIKGVSDYGDGNKNDDWQLTAAKAAVDYAHFKLESAFLE